MEIDEQKSQGNASNSSEIQNLLNILSHIKSESSKITTENKQTIEQKINEIQTVANKFKTLIDTISNDTITKLNNEMKSDENAQTTINNNITNFENRINQLQTNNSNVNNDNNIKQEYEKCKKDIFMFQKNNKKQQTKKVTFTNSESANRNKDINKEKAANENGLADTEKIENDILLFFKENYSYTRAKNKDINKYINQIDWKWDYCNKKDDKHQKHLNKNNGKTLKCNVSDKKMYCDCFYRINNEMLPNSGIYRLRLLINKVTTNDSGINIIGITCTLDDNNNVDPKGRPWWYSNDYVGWSHVNGKIRNCEIPNGGGLYCSGSNDDARNNIFYKWNLKYKSNNEYYKYRLPGFIDNDIIILEYDSNQSILTFQKENKSDDGELLNSYVYNLPNDRKLYWFVGHFLGKMSITILDSESD